MNDTNTMERTKPAVLESTASDIEETSQIVPEQEFQEPGMLGLPFEPPNSTGLEGKETADETLRQLLTFFFYGPESTDGGTQSHEDLPGPALLYQYRDLSKIRHDYPGCLNEAGTDSAVLTLAVVIDELIAKLTDGSDAGQVMTQHIYQLESEIRALADNDYDAGFLSLWDQVAKKLQSSPKLHKDKKEILRKNLDTARGKLEVDYELIGCDAEAPVRMLSTLMVFHWQKHCEQWREQLESLVRQLQDILSVDFEYSMKAKSPDYLQKATSTDDINFEAMASIMATDRLAKPLEKPRSERIQTILTTLLKIKPLFTSQTFTGEGGKEPPFSIRLIFEDCSSAIGAHHSRMHIMTEFFKAVSIARLEVENRYREELHNDFFSTFNISKLTSDELALCPPVLLRLSSNSLKQGNIVELLEILGSGMPIKILLLVDELYKCRQEAGPSVIHIDWPVRLANMAMGLNQSFVFQASISRLPFLHRGLLDGLEYAGPALFSVYTGKMETRSTLPAYLAAAAAVESRAFPLFSFNPGRGQTQAERMDVSGNSLSDQEWPVESFNYKTANNEEATTELTFTLADHLLCDQRFASQFRCMPTEFWHENMLPLHQYLDLDEEATQTHIPYLLTVDIEGQIGKVIMARAIVELARQCSSSWRSLQESGGINNSFAMNLIAEQKDKLVAEMQQQVEVIEAKNTEQLDQHIGKLTEEIVQRIVAQLFRDSAGSVDMLARTTAVPPAQAKPGPAVAPAEQSIPTEEAAIAGEEEDEEDGLWAFDDPYIDTPLCTSCDECTNLNGQIFAYDENKQAYINDATAGPYKDIVRSAELCPVKIIHPGKPKNPSEANLDDLLNRTAPFM